MGKKKKKIPVVIQDLPFGISVYAGDRRVYNYECTSEKKLNDNYKYVEAWLGSDWELHKEKPDLFFYGIVRMENERYYAY